MTLITRGEYSLSAGMSAKILPYLNDLVKRIYHSYIKKSSNFNSNNNNSLNEPPLFIFCYFGFSQRSVSHTNILIHVIRTERNGTTGIPIQRTFTLISKSKRHFLIRGFKSSLL